MCGGINLTGYDLCIDAELDHEKLYKHKLSPMAICKRMSETFNDALFIPSPSSLGRISVLLDTSKVVISEQYSRFVDPECKAMVYANDVVLPLLVNTILFGVHNIKNVYIEKKLDEWYVACEGSNLPIILGIPTVDATQTVSNNMWEIYDVFGIEATREFLIQELTDVVTSDGTYVNFTHIHLIADIMTFYGTIRSISRYGLNKERDCGPLAKASFEESLENLVRAGVYGETETTNGVSSCVMLGKMANIGTGLCDITYDIAKACEYFGVE